MSRSLLLILAGIGGLVMEDPTHFLFAQGAYPRVMSPTGRFYGPTQAHYQYERQYGQPWHGGPARYDPNTGAQVQVHGWGGFPGYGAYSVYGGNAPFSNYGYGYSVQRFGFPMLGVGVPFGGGYAGGTAYYGGGAYVGGVYQNQFTYGPIQQYQVIPQAIYPQVGFAPATTFSWQQPDPFQIQQPNQGVPQPGNPVGAQAVNAGGPNPDQPQPVMHKPHDFLPAPPSTAAQRQKSIHLQGQGDVWFRQQNYLQAYSRYKQAASAAPDLAAPRFRMGYALMALQRYELAVPEFQRGIRLDPQYPIAGDSLADVYGEDNRLAAAALPQAVAAWVKQDIRSSDRLFLLGALLMINGDHVRARVLLETAAQFGAEGPTEHITAFLRLDAAIANAAAGGQQPAAEKEKPPVPEAVEKVLQDDKIWLPAPPKKTGPAVVPPMPKVPQPPAPAADEPAEAKVPAATKPAPQLGAITPIPKKGSGDPKPASDPKPAEIEPTAAESTNEGAGPVIPIPNSSN